jgi:hypothetical protein
MQNKELKNKGKHLNCKNSTKPNQREKKKKKKTQEFKSKTKSKESKLKRGKTSFSYEIGSQ